ncbi:CubicO group peptidase, beta-lactamase class C family [Asanoa hainanensis]|uniref:CubicO group peptidase, beta-lactamase class C family n=1 Tax=Asanoa hainanensis TaxID=560556 RepID=A0A239K0Y3_9ACTN|nr:serine hydrolase domain-containing protein [Asanoa hainanensis]SNT11976.1 CubicO group peptidase, beta-lactamase class C family [Asanoa hainanensis]
MLSTMRLRRMREVLTGYVERGDVPGVVALVSRRGQTHVEALGTTAYGGGRPMSADTIFRVSSMTKPITAAATMMLVEECRIRLDDPVDALLPELADRQVLRSMGAALHDTVPAFRPVTVRDLLTFTWGFGQVYAPADAYPVLKAAWDLDIGMGEPRPRAMPDQDEWLKRLGSLPLMAQPGEKWFYNTGSDVLGVLLSRASGLSYADFLLERVFAPLGMTDTGFSVVSLERLANGYWGDPVEALDTQEEWASVPPFFSGAGGVVSTVDDFFAFGRMMLGAGPQRLLSRPSLATMTADHLTRGQKVLPHWVADEFAASGWGFGGKVTTHRHTIADTPGRYGWDGGLGTSWRIDPAEEMITILMTQRAWSSPEPPPILRDFWTLAYQAIDD